MCWTNSARCVRQVARDVHDQDMFITAADVCLHGPQPPTHNDCRELAPPRGTTTKHNEKSADQSQPRREMDRRPHARLASNRSNERVPERRDDHIRADRLTDAPSTGNCRICRRRDVNTFRVADVARQIAAEEPQQKRSTVMGDSSNPQPITSVDSNSRAVHVSRALKRPYHDI